MSTNKATAGDTGTFNTLHGTGSMFGEVATGGDTMPWKIEQRDGQFCVIKEGDGDVEGCHETEELAKAQMAALYASEDKGLDLTRDSFTVYKQDDGTYRWASVSSVAVKDKEFEIVTEKAQDDAIQHAIDTGQFGEIDLVTLTAPMSANVT